MPDKKQAAQTAPQSAPLILAAIIQAVGAITKTKTLDAAGAKFKYRGIDDIYNVLHPLFSGHGMVCLPIAGEYERSIHKNNKGNNVFGSVLRVGYRFLAPDGSYVDATGIGEGFDFSDKSMAKAIADAHKRVLIQTFLIPTEEDAENEADFVIDARQELKDMAAAREEDAKRLVRQGGENIPLPEHQEAELERKRAELQSQIDEREGKLAPGQTAVDETGPAQTAATDPGVTKPAKPAKPTSKPTAPEKPSAEPPQEPAPQQPAPVPAAKGPPCFEHVITALKHAKYRGRKVGDLTLAELNLLNVNWIAKFKDDIKGNPELEELRDNLLAALAIRKGEGGEK